jgi:hypothetical protein
MEMHICRIVANSLEHYFYLSCPVLLAYFKHCPLSVADILDPDHQLSLWWCGFQAGAVLFFPEFGLFAMNSAFLNQSGMGNL